MHARAGLANSTLGQRPIARPIRIDEAVGFQAGQPLPAVLADGLEIGQATIPTVERHVARMKAACFGGLEHGEEMRVFGQAVDGLIKQPIVAWDGVLAITPPQRHQIDAADDPMMLARPMAMNQFDFLGIRLVERGIVEDQKAALTVDMLLGLAPERRGIGFEPLEEAGQRIVGSTARSIRLHPGGFGTRHHLRCGDQKIDIVEISDFWCIHGHMVLHNAPTA